MMRCRPSGQSLGLVDNIVAMTNDISDVMRFEQGATLCMRRAPCDVRALAVDAVDAAAPLCKPGVALVLEVGARVRMFHSLYVWSRAGPETWRRVDGGRPA
jgi:hypothetical protein